MKKFSKAILSKELLVAAYILEAQERVGYATFTSLAERMGKEQLASRGTVSKALDILFDQGLVKAEWTQREDMKHVRALTIDRHALEFVRKIQENIE